jgi:hypothetical protein
MPLENVTLLRSVRWSSPGAFVRDRVERRPADLTRSVLLPLMSRVVSTFGGGAVVETPSEVPADIDEFATRSTAVSHAHPLTASYLERRWFDAPSEWALAVARDRNGKLTGYAVYGPDPAPPDDIASNRGMVVDLFGLDPSATTSLLRHCWAALRKRGCDVVAFDHSDPRPWSRRSHLRAGFWPVEAGPKVTIEREAGVEPVFWYLTRADSTP